MLYFCSNLVGTPRWVIGNVGFTRYGQEYLTKLARDIIADDNRLYASQQSDLDPEG